MSYIEQLEQQNEELKELLARAQVSVDELIELKQLIIERQLNATTVIHYRSAEGKDCSYMILNEEIELNPENLIYNWRRIANIAKETK